MRSVIARTMTPLDCFHLFRAERKQERLKQEILEFNPQSLS